MVRKVLVALFSTAAFLGLSQWVEARPNCVSPNYHHNEAKNRLGPNRCKTHCDCDGARTCSPHGWCQGVARPPVRHPKVNCVSPNYRHNEANNRPGPNRCKTHCDCDGARTCSAHGWCQGVARPAPRRISCVSPLYRHNEAKNRLGPNRCKTHCDCDGARTCSPHGWCQGRAR